MAASLWDCQELWSPLRTNMPNNDIYKLCTSLCKCYSLCRLWSRAAFFSLWVAITVGGGNNLTSHSQYFKHELQHRETDCIITRVCMCWIRCCELWVKQSESHESSLNSLKVASENTGSWVANTPFRVPSGLDTGKDKGIGLSTGMLSTKLMSIVFEEFCFSLGHGRTWVEIVFVTRVVKTDGPTPPPEFLAQEVWCETCELILQQVPRSCGCCYLRNTLWELVFCIMN